MRTFFLDVKCGFMLLFVYVLLTYFGAVQLTNSPNFEAYTSDLSKDIEGSGAVFVYIMSAPIVEVIMAIIISLALTVVFFVLSSIFKTITSVRIKMIFLTICSLIILFCSYIVGMNIANEFQWGFYISCLANFILIAYGLFVIGHLWFLQEKKHA